MQDLTVAMEQYLSELRKALVAQAVDPWHETGVSPAVPGLLAEPEYIRPGLQPHLSNAIRRMNDVIREQAFTEWWQADTAWALGRKIQSARKETPSIRSVAFLGKLGSHSHRSATTQYPEAEMLPVGAFSEAVGHGERWSGRMQRCFPLTIPRLEPFRMCTICCCSTICIS